MRASRPADLAGRWYPADASACDRFIEQIETPNSDAAPARVVGAIVPHAGWVYSGAVAYQTLAIARSRVPDADLVIVFGGHLGRRDRPRIFIEGAWDTPYGRVSIAESLAQDISMSIESDLESPEDYFDDNAIEVLMPMVKRLWPSAKAVTVGLPPVPAAIDHGRDVVDLAKRQSFSRIVVVGSTDLTHYGPNYDYQPHGSGHQGLEWVKTKNDPDLIAPMEALDGQKVLWVAERARSACCPGAVAAALAGARSLGATHGKTVRYTTSFDVRPSEARPSSFVGYVGIVLGD